MPRKKHRPRANKTPHLKAQRREMVRLQSSQIVYTGQLIRNGIVGLGSSPFGTADETISRAVNGFEHYTGTDFDNIDPATGDRIENKGSRAYLAGDVCHEDTLAFCLQEANSQKALATSTEDQRYYNCNINSLKVELFDWLYYTLYFSDVVMFFRMPCDDLEKQYCYNKQGNSNKKSVEGHMYINAGNLQHFMNKYHYLTLTYDEIAEKLESYRQRKKKHIAVGPASSRGS